MTGFTKYIYIFLFLHLLLLYINYAYAMFTIQEGLSTDSELSKSDESVTDSNDTKVTPSKQQFICLVFYCTVSPFKMFIIFHKSHINWENVIKHNTNYWEWCYVRFNPCFRTKEDYWKECLRRRPKLPKRICHRFVLVLHILNSSCLF